MKNLNLTNLNIYLAFFNNRGERELIELNKKNSNLINGECIFDIPAEKSAKILEFKNKSFHIISMINGKENSIYHGTFDNLENFSKYKDSIKEKELLEKENKEIKIQEIIDNSKNNNLETNIQSLLSNENIIKNNKLKNIFKNEKLLDKEVNSKAITIKDVNPKNNQIKNIENKNIFKNDKLVDIEKNIRFKK